MHETGARAPQKPWRFFGMPGKNGGLAHHRGTDHRKGESGKSKGIRLERTIESSGVHTTEEIRQRRLELDKLLQTPPVDEEIARQKAMELAVLTLVSVEMEEYEAHRLRSIFGKQAKMRELDANLLQQGVRKITYGSKTVKVLLKNNQVLEECDDA